MPAASRAFELGQWATPVPAAPNRSTSEASRWTACANQTSPSSQPELLDDIERAPAEARQAVELLLDRLGEVRVQAQAESCAQGPQTAS